MSSPCAPKRQHKRCSKLLPLAACLSCLALEKLSAPRLARHLQGRRWAGLRLHRETEVNWNKVAADALAEAQKLMEDDFLVLSAESVLSSALQKLEGLHVSSKAKTAAKEIRAAPLFSEVLRHIGLYDSARATLAPAGFDLCWKRNNTAMYFRSPPGASWFEFRVVAQIDAPLRHCLAPLHERDLIQKYQPVFVEPHLDLDTPSKHYAVIRTLSRIMTFYIETIFELVRVPNHKFGYLVEIARSEFPVGKRTLPEKKWWSTRINVDTRNLWLPCGGNNSGTILVSIARVDVGVPVPAAVQRFIANGFAQNILNNVRVGSAFGSDEASPWSERIRQDAEGFYAELAAVEAAAAKRRAVSVSDLPGEEVFDRPGKLRPD